MCSGSRSSVQNAMRPGPYSASRGSSACRLRAAVASRISSHMPARSRSRPSSARVRLVVGADAGGGVRVERAAEHAGRVAVDVMRERELRELARGAADDAGEVHHLGEPDHAPPAEQRVEVARCQLATRRLELRCRHARRRHEEDVERDVVAERRSASARRRCRARSRSRAGRRRPRSCRTAARAARTRRRAASTTRGACARR